MTASRPLAHFRLEGKGGKSWSTSGLITGHVNLFQLLVYLLGQGQHGIVGIRGNESYNGISTAEDDSGRFTFRDDHAAVVHTERGA